MEIPWPGADQGKPRLPNAPYAVYCQTPAGRYELVPFDLDDAKPGADITGDLAMLRAVLETADVGHVVVASRGYGARRHVLTRWPGGVDPVEVAALGRALRRRCATLDTAPLSGSGTAAIRPPFSPHRTGRRAEVIGDVDEALTTLRRGNDAAAWKRLLTAAGVTAEDRETARRRRVRALALNRVDPHSTGNRQPRARRALPRPWERAWRDGTGAPVAADYGSTRRSELLQALAIVCVMYGWTRDDFAQRCRDPRYAGGDRARRKHAPYCRCAGRHTYIARSPDAVTDQITRYWEAARVFVADNPPTFDPSNDSRPGRARVDQRVTEMWDALYAHKWTGRDGVHDRQLLAYLLLLAYTTGRLEIGGSVRSWAVQAGLTKSTVHRSLERLTAAGWLRLSEAHSGTKGRVYEITLPENYIPETHSTNGTLALHPAPTPSVPTLDHLAAAVADRRHDVFDWQGLGSVAGLIYSEIREDGSTASELEQLLAFTKSTIIGHCRRLARYGLLTLHGDRWRRERAALDSAAERLGCCGARARRASAYDLDRLLYRWYLADFNARRGWAVERGHYHPEHHQHVVAGLDLELPGFPHRNDVGSGAFVPAWTDARQHLVNLLTTMESPRTRLAVA